MRPSPESRNPHRSGKKPGALHPELGNQTVGRVKVATKPSAVSHPRKVRPVTLDGTFRRPQLMHRCIPGDSDQLPIPGSRYQVQRKPSGQ